MLDAESGGGARQIGFVADTVTAGPVGSGMGLVVSQTEFKVDLAQVQKLLTGLADARDRLQELNDDALLLRSMGSPGKDVYSGMAAMAVRQTAGTDVGGYSWANRMAYEALNKTIQNIQNSLDAYRNQDEASADSFTAGGSSR